MEVFSDNINSSSNKSIYRQIDKNDNSFEGSLIDKYSSLLYKLGLNFGFNDEEINDLIRQVDCNVNKIRCLQEHHSLRILIVKDMVYRCVFKISSELFNKIDWKTETKQYGSYNSGYKSRHEFMLHHMPLTFRTVFILSNLTNFSETEVAELLNITRIKVKER